MLAGDAILTGAADDGADVLIGLWAVVPATQRGQRGQPETKAMRAGQELVQKGRTRAQVLAQRGGEFGLADQAGSGRDQKDGDEDFAKRQIQAGAFAVISTDRRAI